jgi:alpha-1,2-mannosyltransferase
MTRECVVEFLRDRVIFAKLAAITLWFCYALSIGLGPHADDKGTDLSFSGKFVGRETNSWIVYDEHYGTFNIKGEINGADHLAWYTAARLIAEGKPDKVYDYTFVTRYQHDLIPKERWNSLMAYRNPPFYALLYLPTCQLPFTLSWAIWCLIYLVWLWFAVKWLGGGRPEFLWLLAFFPTFTAFSYGQNSLISFTILAGTYRLLKSDRVFLAGLVAGLLWFKPPLLTGLILWGVLDLRRLWPAALGVVLSGLLLTLGSYPFIPDVWEGFVRSLTGNVKFDNFEQFKMHNPLAFFRLLAPDAKAWHWPLAGICSLLAILWFVRIWRSHRRDPAIMMGAVAFVTLWGSPHALIYEWSVLGVTAVLWWKKMEHDRPARFLLFGAAWLALFLSTHFAELQVNNTGRAVQVSVPILAAVAVYAMKFLPRDSAPAGGGVQ